MSGGADGSPGHPDTEAPGDLFLYSPWGYAAFEVGGRGAGPRALVCVGGLTDGFLSLRYMPALAEAVKGEGWRVIQPVLSSSYRGWGVGSLDEDVRELDTLLRFLADRRGVQQVALLGSSTGCQDTVRYLQKGAESKRVVAAVLQAPVSDRESVMVDGGDEKATAVKRYREQASAMIAEGRGDAVLPREAWKLLGPPDHPVSAYRFDSLTGRLTDDDMFSSDLSKEELRSKLGHVSVPTLLVGSADDEYVPSFVDKQGLLQRISDATGSGTSGLNEVLMIKQGGHGLSSKAAGLELSAAVAGFLSRLPAVGAPAAAAAPRVTWEPGLAEKIKARAAAHAAGAAAGRPLLVALAGPPGSGKSTSAAILAEELGDVCVVLGMDGFHATLAELRARPDAKEAVYRRGAPDTFQPEELRRRLGLILSTSGPEEVEWPGFDHAVGDPVPDGARFRRNRHEVVLVEGLYLLLEQGAWCGTAELFDLRLYLDEDIETCVARVKERNKCIPGYTPEEIDTRCEVVDRANAVTVAATAARADVRVSASSAA